MEDLGLTFSVQAWSFCRGGAEKPELPQIPPLLRRRASVAARLALQAVYSCVPEEKSLPTVFCSRHGEVSRSVELMELMARGEGHLPMAFSLSVHNAAAGLYGISRGDTSNSSSLAAGKDTLPMGMIEACGLIQGGQSKVLVVAFDDAVPEVLAAFRDEMDPPSALALLVGAGSAFSLRLSLPREGSKAVLDEAMVPRVGHFLAGTEAQLHAGRWLWQRHD